MKVAKRAWGEGLAVAVLLMAFGARAARGEDPGPRACWGVILQELYPAAKQAGGKLPPVTTAMEDPEEASKWALAVPIVQGDTLLRQSRTNDKDLYVHRGRRVYHVATLPNPASGRAQRQCLPVRTETHSGKSASLEVDSEIANVLRAVNRAWKNWHRTTEGEKLLERLRVSCDGVGPQTKRRLATMGPAGMSRGGVPTHAGGEEARL